MRIKTRYLLLVPIVLISLIISSMFIYNSIMIEKFWNISPSVIDILGLIFTIIYSVLLIVFLTHYIIENWNNDFYVNLKFKNKSREL